MSAIALPGTQLQTQMSPVITKDVFVRFVSLANTTASAVAVTIVDGQGVALLSNASIAAGATLYPPVPSGRGAVFKGGIQAVASSSGVHALFAVDDIFTS